MSRYMGTRLSQKVAWSQNFASHVGEDPVALGLTAEQVDLFTTKNTALQAAWTVIQEPSARTKVTVADFHSKLRGMQELAYELVAIIQANKAVTDVQKIALGIPVRDTVRTPVAVPSSKPFIKVLGVDGRSVMLELQQDDKSRGKPEKVSAATILTHLGPTAPDGTQWMFSTNVTRTRTRVTLPPSDTGDTVWITAFWRNSKDQGGPAATPISVNLPAGSALPTQQEEAA